MQYLKQDELDRLSSHNLPIVGGDGQSLESAYILNEVNKLKAPSLEHLIIDLTLKASGFLFWKLVKQSLTIGDDRKIDFIKVNAMKNGEAKEFDFYFDLTRLEQ